MNALKNNKDRLFEVMSKIDKTFKPTLNEDLQITTPEKNEVDEGWAKNLTTGALMTAATLGNINNAKGQMQQTSIDNSTKTELVQPNANKLPFKSPNDVINFAQKIINDSITYRQVESIFSLESKGAYKKLINSNNEWKLAFDTALSIIYDYQRKEVKFTLFLKNNKADTVGQQLNINTNNEFSLNDKQSLVNQFNKNNLKEYYDFIFMVNNNTKGSNWNQLQKKHEALEYYNWDA